MGRGRNNDDEMIGCVAQAIFVIFLMPIVGIIMINSENPDKKSIGWLLLIVGVILWIVMATANAG